MKTSMKIISLLLALMMVMSCVACGGDSEATPTPPASENTATPEAQGGEPTAEPGGSEATPQPTLDLGGRAVRWSCWWLIEEPDPTKNEYSKLESERRQKLYADNKFSIQYIEFAWDDYISTLSTNAMAGTPATDIAELSPGWMYPGLIGSGALYAWNDSAYLNPEDEKWCDSVTDGATYKGQVYGSFAYPYYPRAIIFWNQTMFEKNGLTSVYDLMENDTWNWETFSDYCETLTQDFDKDGTPDQYAFAGDGFENQIIFNNAGETISINDDGSVSFKMTNPNTIAALQYFTDLVGKSYQMPAPAGASWDWYVTEFNNGTLGMIDFGYYQASSFMETMEDSFGLCYAPKGPSNTGDYVAAIEDFNIFSIFAKVDEPEEVAFALNVMTDNELALEYWQDTYEAEVGDDRTLDFVESILFNDKNQISNKFMWFDALKNHSYEYRSRYATEGVQTVIEEIAPAAQQICDELFSGLEGDEN